MSPFAMYIARHTSILSTLLLAIVVGGGVSLAGAQIATMGVWIGLLPAGLILWLGLRSTLRRWRIARAPMPDRWQQWLAAHVPLYNKLDETARECFDRDVRFVLEEYSFEGIQDVEVTESLQLSVAAGVAVLLHGRPSWELPGSSTVLFYPERFNDDYLESTGAAYDGMAHQQGPIILTARAVEASWSQGPKADSLDADNVVLHELAHLFDFDNEGADGVPSLVAASSAADWQALVRSEMQRVRRGQSILRPYAAEAPSEFFAVAVETFFEQPHRMAHHHEALFHALVAFFHLDPRTGERTSTVEEQITENVKVGDD